MVDGREGNGTPRAEQAQRVAREQPHEAFGKTEPEPPPAPPKKPFYKRPLPLIIGGTILVAAVVIGVLWYLHSRHFESTDDAFIQADVTQVSPRVAGHVIDVRVQDNQNVPKDMEIVTLDPDEFETKVKQADAAYQAAKSSLVQSQQSQTVVQAELGQAQAAEQASQTEAQRAHDELARYQKLPPEAVTQQQLINLAAAARSADAQLEAARKKTAAAQAQVNWSGSAILVAEAQVDQAEATLKQATLQLAYTRIHAAISGTVTNRAVQVGDYVQVGQALLALVPREVYAIANFKETQLTDMQPGQDVEIKVDAYPGHVFHGKVQSIQRGSGAAFSLLPPENATGNYVKVVQRVPVKIVFDSEGFPLGPGMSIVPKVKVR